MTASPASTTSHSNPTPVASSTRRVASASSGPMPSPGMSVTRCVIAAARSPAARSPAARSRAARSRVVAPAGEPPPDHLDRVVVAVGDTLLERDDRVVGDLDVLGADLGAALRDVAVADTAVVLEELPPVSRVDRVHLEAGDTHEEPRPDELVLRHVVAQDVADVLAEEALDALPEFLDPLDVLLLPAPLLLGHVLGRPEGRDPAVHLVVPRDVRHEVTDEREGAHRLDGDRLFRLEVREPRLAREARPPIHLRAARSALRRLAVPADGEVVGEVRLDPVE